MSEGNRFVVEVVGKLKEAREVTVSRVCEALALDEPRAAALVARMPGVITKPMGEDRAMKIVLRLQEAGVPALHRPQVPEDDVVKSGERPAAAMSSHEPTDAPVFPRDIPSLDATHHDLEPDPKQTAMTAAGFGAADIVLPTDDARSAQERPRPRATFVEAGSTSEPTPGDDDPAMTMVRPASQSPTPTPPGRNGKPTPVPSSRGASATPVPKGRYTATPVPASRPTPVPAGRPTAAPAPAGEPRDPTPTPGAAPIYRQTRSSAEPPLTLSAPPDEALQRGGVPETDFTGPGRRSRGRFGRHLAAQVALPGLLTWSLTAVALWWFLGTESTETFLVLAAASAVAALIGSLVAALGTVGVARDVVRLRDEARRVAMGELTSPVASNRDDELGELAGSLERMRLSLQEGLERLRQRKR